MLSSKNMVSLAILFKPFFHSLKNIFLHFYYLKIPIGLIFVPIGAFTLGLAKLSEQQKKNGDPRLLEWMESLDIEEPCFKCRKLNLILCF